MQHGKVSFIWNIINGHEIFGVFLSISIGIGTKKLKNQIRLCWVKNARFITYLGLSFVLPISKYVIISLELDFYESIEYLVS